MPDLGGSGNSSCSELLGHWSVGKDTRGAGKREIEPLLGTHRMQAAIDMDDFTRCLGKPVG